MIVSLAQIYEHCEYGEYCDSYTDFLLHHKIIRSPKKVTQEDMNKLFSAYKEYRSIDTINAYLKKDRVNNCTVSGRLKQTAIAKEIELRRVSFYEYLISKHKFKAIDNSLVFKYDGNYDSDKKGPF